MKKIKVIFIAFILTVFANLILPREFYTGDFGIHMPFILKQNNPELFKNDYFVTSANPQSDTMYYKLLTILIANSQLSQESTIKVFYTLILFFFFLGIVCIAKNLQNYFVGFTWSLLLLLRFPIAGTATQIIEVEPIPRFLGLVLNIWCSYFLLKKRWLEALLLFLFGFFIHPLSSFFLLCIVTAEYIRRTRREKIAFAFFSSGIIILFLFPVTNKMWVDIIDLRNSYAFINNWSITSFVILFASLLPGIWYSFFSKNKTNNSAQLFKVTIITSIIITFVHISFAIIHPLSLIINLQLERIWLYPAVISLLMMAILITQTRKIIVVILLVCILAIVVQRNIIAHQEIDKKWLAVQEWAALQTNQDCIFLVPFQSRGFRVTSRRATTGEYKDGTLSFYSQDFAFNWRQRLNEINQWQERTDQELADLQKKYMFNYVVEETNYMKRSFPVMYENPSYRLYKINECK